MAFQGWLIVFSRKPLVLTSARGFLYDTGMRDAKTAVVYDLDSTIAHTVHRHHLFPSAEQDGNVDAWIKYSQACPDDIPITGTVARMEMDAAYHQVHISTGRFDITRPETENWLAQYRIPYDFLKMRVTDTLEEKNSLIKIRYIKQLEAQGITVLLVYEDSARVAAAISKGTGVPVLGINPFYPKHIVDEFRNEVPVSN